MSDRKEKFISDTMVEILIGFTALVGLYIWKYNSLSAGRRFLGMVFISLIVGVAVQLFMMTISRWRTDRLEKNELLICAAQSAFQRITANQKTSQNAGDI